MRNNALKPVALALLGIGAWGSAVGGETVDLGGGFLLDWRVNTTYTLSQRVKSPDSILTGYGSGNDGDKNFHKGDLTANRLGVFFDGHLRKGDSGFVMSASTFYDDVYHKGNANTTPINTPGPVNQFADETQRYHGGYTRLLDAYGYTNFNIGDQGKLNLRLGRHVVSWGEALFFGGISLAQGPADGTKQGVAGTEVKDQVLPEDQFSFTYAVNPDWSVVGHAQYGFHQTIAPAPGSFLSASDSTGPGANCQQPYVNGRCSFGLRVGDDKPNGTQWGIGTRYRITDETELGLFYLNYHDRTPSVYTDAMTSILPPSRSASYQIGYFDNIKLTGLTLSTSLGMASLAMEVSYKQGAPVLVNAFNPYISAVLPTPTRADILQTNVNSTINFGRTPLAPQTLLLAEVAYISISNVESARVPGTNPLPNLRPTTATDKLTFGSYGFAAGATLSLTYPGVFEGWDLGVPLSYQYQIGGRTLTGGLGAEGDGRYSVGTNFTYRGNFQIGVSYNGFLGSPSTATDKYQRLFTDRDYVSMTMKYSF